MEMVATTNVRRMTMEEILEQDLITVLGIRGGTCRVVIMGGISAQMFT
jgi:hypothetical protein